MEEMNRPLVVIDDSPVAPAAYNMALDELLLTSTVASERYLCRLYGWHPAAVSIGRNQKVSEAVDLDLLRDEGIPLVRRPTGGRAIWHGGDICFTYCGASPGSGLPVSAFKSDYMRAAVAIVRMLESLGIQASISPGRPVGKTLGVIKAPCFQSSGRFEITAQGRKIAGIAQYRSDDRFLIQGSVRHSMIDEKYRKLFFVRGKKGDVAYNQLRNSVVSINEITGREIGFAEMLDAFVYGVGSKFADRIERKALVNSTAIENLIVEKYGNRKWNYRI